MRCLTICARHHIKLNVNRLCRAEKRKEKTAALCHSLMHDDVQAKKVHILMCLQRAVQEDSSACGNHYLALMARFTYIWAKPLVKAPVVTAISRALPGRSQGSMPYTDGHACVPSILPCSFVSLLCLFWVLANSHLCSFKEVFADHLTQLEGSGICTSRNVSRRQHQGSLYPASMQLMSSDSLTFKQVNIS